MTIAKTIWDPQTQVGIPPIDAVFPVEVGTAWAIGYAALAALVLVYGLLNLRQLKGQVILMFMVGGLLNGINEPILDVLTNCWHPEIDQPTAFTLFGRDMPWWVPAVYMFYFGGVAGLNFIAFKKGVNRLTVWLWFLVPTLLDIAMEEAMLSQNLYYYYGNQPLILINKFPLWYAFCNSLAETTAVASVVLLLPYLKGKRLLYVALIPPATMAMVYATVAAPVIYAINQENIAPWLAQAAGLVTVGLCLWVVYGVAAVLATARRPAASPAATESGLETV